MKIVVANHKMNLTKPELQAYLLTLKEKVRQDLTIVICPNMLYLTIADGKNYFLGSQNVAPLESGSLTGEVSASQLKSLHVSYCLVGHSERRNTFQETSEMIQKKIRCLLNVGIIPILCIGETKEQRALRKTDLVLEKELKECLQGFTKEEITSILIAYEPIWAIGTGLVPNNQEITRIASTIREVLNHHFGVETSILYGGSVHPGNIETLEKIKNIDGYLVGGASLKIEEWLTLLNRME